MRSGLFITGTDTEVGKTFVACKILRQLRKLRHRVAAYKPVASGGRIDHPCSDPSLLAMAAGMPQTPSCLARVCPQYFSAPLAPPVAATLEDKLVDDALLLEGFRWWQQNPDWDALVVEGAGGLLSPISSTRTVLDLIQLLRLPVVVVAANRLGMVNHVLLTLAALEQANAKVLAVMLNSRPSAAALAGENTSDFADISVGSNLELLRSFTKTPIVESAEDVCEIALQSGLLVEDCAPLNNQVGTE